MYNTKDKTNWLIFLLGLVFILSVSCHRYYKPVPADTTDPQATSSVISSNVDKYLILRSGSKSYRLTDVTLDNEAMSLKATLTKVDQAHLQYINAKGRKYKYKDSATGHYDKNQVLQEVHIYSKDTSSLDVTQTYSLPFDQIQKIELIQHDKSRTGESYFLGGVGYTLGVIAVVVAMVVIIDDARASTNTATYGGAGCNCPYVSVYDGNQFVQQGELFTGAINQKLERPDYLPLDIQPIDGEFQLRISNELEEIQYTDYADLVVVEHSNNTQAGFGTDGKPYLISNPVSPTAARLNDNRDVLRIVREKDWMSCSFDDTLGTSSLNEIMLTFPNAGNKQKGKLVLNLKNAYWFEYVFGIYTSQFGNRFDKWMDQVNDLPKEDMNRWIEEQDMPLTISVSTSDGWKEVIKLNPVGPLTNRKVVIPVGFDTRFGEPVRVKLSSGFLFWELDYAGMDFTKDETVTTMTLKPYAAVDEAGRDVLSFIADSDHLYLTQPEIGNYTTLKYKSDKIIAPGMTYSVVLAAKGYYELISDYSGKPNIAFLDRFKSPGALSAFSMEQYQLLFRNQDVAGMHEE